jgi:hypothetical protein
MREGQQFVPAVALWVAAAVLAFATLVSWFPFGLGCSIGENYEGAGWETLCDYSGFYWLGPLLAAVPCGLLGFTERLSRRAVAVAVVLGLLVVVAPWILFGDPAGNFDGLFDLD